VGEGVTIETERLHLRPLTLEDEDALAAVLGDTEVMRWFPSPLTREQVHEWIKKQIGLYDGTGAGRLAMIEKQTGAFVGDCGLLWQEIDKGMEPEVGYRVNRLWWNRGFATEAAKAVMDYAFGTMGLDHVISLIRPENVQSRKVAEKNGLMFDRIILWHDYDHCVYERWK
jgi:RimJ/RimL family protein N-acetyltransferase